MIGEWTSFDIFCKVIDNELLKNISLKSGCHRLQVDKGFTFIYDYLIGGCPLFWKVNWYDPVKVFHLYRDVTDISRILLY